MEVCNCLLAVLLACICRSALADYQNFTVGDKEGWRPNPSVSYAKWASDKNFTLGDYLIFNFADPNYDVIRTYNATVYKNCDYMDSNGDFEVWGELETTMASAIPLVEMGPNYFFCGVNNSKLCKEGMKFTVTVTEGDGLPASLAIPPPAPTNGTSSTQPSSPDGDANGSSSSDNDNSGAPYRHSFTVSILVSLLVPSVIIPLLC